MAATARSVLWLGYRKHVSAPRRGKGCFSSLRGPDRMCGHPASCLMGPGTLFPSFKGPLHEDDHSCQYGAEVKNTWSRYFISLYIWTNEWDHLFLGAQIVWGLWWVVNETDPFSEMSMNRPRPWAVSIIIDLSIMTHCHQIRLACRHS
jgi:hypothetical protein